MRRLSTQQGWVWRATLVTLVTLAGCSEQDVVAYPLKVRTPPDDIADAAIDRCELGERAKQARLSEDLVRDVRSPELPEDACSFPIEDFVLPDAGQQGFSLEQLKRIIGAQPPLVSQQDSSTELLCAQFPNLYVPEPRDNPSRIVLCSMACAALKRFVDGVLALDGCDDKNDAAGVP